MSSPETYLLHARDILLADDIVIDDGLGIVRANHAARRLLYGQRGLPRLVDVIVGKLLQLRQPFSNIFARLVRLFAKGHLFVGNALWSKMKKKNRQNSHLINHCPTSEGVSERANE